MSKHPLDEHAQAIGAPHPRNPAYPAYIKRAADVLRVELSREPARDEIFEAMHYATGMSGVTPTRMKNAIKAAMAQRLKALGLDT